jgi:hypothetical protein
LAMAPTAPTHGRLPLATCVSIVTAACTAHDASSGFPCSAVDRVRPGPGGYEHHARHLGPMPSLSGRLIGGHSSLKGERARHSSV